MHALILTTVNKFKQVGRPSYKMFVCSMHISLFYKLYKIENSNHLSKILNSKSAASVVEDTDECESRKQFVCQVFENKVDLVK